MKLKVSEMILPLFLTILVLLFLEIISTSLIPSLGINQFKITFSVLIILYLCFYLNTPYLPILILIIQFFHSIFTIEGWAYGTVTGILISFIVSQLRDVLQLASLWQSLFITFIFQYLWFFIISTLIYFRTFDIQIMIERFWNFIPESIILTICSPILFHYLKKIWKTKRREYYA